MVIREKPLLSTTPDLLLAVLKKGMVSTNVYLRRIQNFALDMGWLPWPILRKKQFPKVRFKSKRGITECEHRRIIGRESNPERRDFYELCWLLGGSQGDIASLTDEDSVASVSLRSGKNRAPAGFRRFDVAGRVTSASQPQPTAAMACS